VCQVQKFTKNLPLLPQVLEKDAKRQYR